MILTRLLVREVYALMDVTMVFLQGLHMFADVGIGTSIVQSKRGDDRDFLNTAWTVQVLRGLVLWGATDRLIVPAYAARWKALIPPAREELIEGAGHMLPYEQPEAFTGAVSAFLG